MRIKSSVLIAMRLKRTASIVEKLKREPHMSLSTMQDVAGIRIIFSKLNEVQAFIGILKKNKWKHELIKTYDYIQNPKKSGYRSFHAIYKYRTQNKSLKNAASVGRKIEIQIRTHLQHIWATTVESFGILRNEALKAGLGDEHILQFFEQLSAVFFLLEQEKHEYSLEEKQQFQSIITKYESLNLDSFVKTIQIAKHISLKENKKKGYLLMKLFPEMQKIYINYYTNETEANAEYTQLEQMGESNVVLVAIEDVKKIQQAYPNYFLDLSAFQKIMKAIKNII